MVVGEVVIELPMHDSLDYFGDDGNERDRSKVGWVRGISGLEDGMDYGVFPRIGNVGQGYAGVDNVKDDTTDSWETGLHHADAHAIGAAGGRAPHAEDRVSEHLPSHGRERK